MKRFLPILFLLLIAALLPLRTQAQDASVTWERFDATITIHDDGSFTVRETWKIRFGEGSFRAGYREIPMPGVDSLKQVRVWDEEGPFLTTTEGAEKPRTFILGKREAEAFFIRWFFDPASNAERTFNLSYRVYGVIDPQGEEGQLNWTLHYPNFNAPLAASTITLVAPGPVQSLAAPPFAAQRLEQEDGAIAYEATEPVPAKAVYDIRATWSAVPAAAPTTAPQPTQAPKTGKKKAPALESSSTTIMAAKAVSGLFFLLGMVGLVWIWRRTKRGDSSAVQDAPDGPINAPPSELAPGLVGILTRGRATDRQIQPRHLTATLVNAARRGCLNITREGKDVLVSLQQPIPADWPRFEQMTVDVVAGEQGERYLSRLRGWFHSRHPHINQAAEKELIERGLYSPRATKIRFRVIVLGWVFSLLGAVILITPFITNQIGYLTVALWPTAASCLLGVLAFVVGYGLIAPTSSQGERETARWKEFGRYLASLPQTDHALTQAQFEAYLPYAYVLKVEKPFLKAWEQNLARDDVAPPAWHHAADAESKPLSASLLTTLNRATDLFQNAWTDPEVLEDL